MFISIIPRVTIVNKTIVYSDTVLSLKEARRQRRENKRVL